MWTLASQARKTGSKPVQVTKPESVGSTPTQKMTSIVRRGHARFNLASSDSLTGRTSGTWRTSSLARTSVFPTEERGSIPLCATS